jgi:hypothetical protein
VTTALETLEGQLAANWIAIRAARTRTEELANRLSSELADLHDANCSVVVTGSLGRAEATEGSDADWVLLVDGPSDPEHAILAREIETRIRAIVPKEVGPTGTFGSIVASHELVHYIAGTRDSNENLTRRILLLSESRALTNALVRERVIRNILARTCFMIVPSEARVAAGRSFLTSFSTTSSGIGERSLPTMPRRCGSAAAGDGASEM